MLTMLMTDLCSLYIELNWREFMLCVCTQGSPFCGSTVMAMRRRENWEHELSVSASGWKENNVRQLCTAGSQQGESCSPTLLTSWHPESLQ